MYHGPLPSDLTAGLCVNSEINVEHLWESIDLSGIFDEPEDDEDNEDAPDARTGSTPVEKATFLDNRQLIEYRNKVLIAAGAILEGRYPAGGWYYLQYPELCLQSEQPANIW